MLKIIETVAERPISFIADPAAIFEPGHVAQLINYDYGKYVDIPLVICSLSDGSRPLGIIDSTKAKASGTLSFDKNEMVLVWVDRAIFQTDQYEDSAKYDIGVGLYVSKRGLFTSVKSFDDSYPVARMITPPSTRHPYFEALWL